MKRLRTGTKLSKEDFLLLRKAIEEEFKKREELAHAFKDQRLSSFYCDSGWTQEEIAEVEGISQSLVSKLLLFGRFLSCFSTTGTKAIPKSLTERRFREYWEQTDSSIGEHPRFRLVLTLLEEHGTTRWPAIKDVAKQLLERCGDWKWRALPEMSSILKIQEKIVKKALWRLDRGHTKGGRVEERLFGSGKQWRVKALREGCGVKREQIESDDVLKFLDQLDDLVTEGLSYSKRNAARCDPTYLHGILKEIDSRMGWLREVIKGKKERFLPEPIKVIAS